MIAIGLAAFTCQRALGASAPFLWDEAYHAMYGLRIADDLRHGRLLAFAYDTYRQVYWPPLDSWFIGAWTLAFGASSAALRLSSVLALAASAAALFAAGVATPSAATREQRLAIGLAGAATLISTTGVLTMSTQVMLEVPALFWLACSLWLYNRTCAETPAPSRWPALLLGISIFAVYLTKTSFGVLFGLAWAGAAILSGRWRRHLPALGVLVALFAVWFAYPAKIPRTLAALVNTPYGPDRFSLEGLFFYPRALLPLAGSWPMLVLWLAALAVSLRSRVLRQSPPVRLVLIYLLIALVSYELAQAKDERHLFPVAFGFAVLTGAAAGALWRWTLPVLLAGHLVVLLAYGGPAVGAAAGPGSLADGLAKAIAGSRGVLVIGTRDIPGGPPVLDYELVAKGAISIDGTGSMVQGAEEEFLARAAPRLPTAMRGAVGDLAHRYPGTAPDASFTAYVGLPLVKPETFSPANFGPHIAALIAGRQISRIVVVTHRDSQIFPELTPDFLRSALDAVGFVPEDAGGFAPPPGTFAAAFKKNKT